MPTPVNIEVESLTNYDDYSGADEVLIPDQKGLDQRHDQKKVNSEQRLNPTCDGDYIYLYLKLLADHQLGARVCRYQSHQKVLLYLTKEVF